MPPSSVTIRQRFIREHGKPAFDRVARAFVDAVGDSTMVHLPAIPEWRRFVSSIDFVPDSNLLPAVFLWCARHSEPLKLADVDTANDWVQLVESATTLQKIVLKNPFALVLAPSGYLCETCNAGARTVANTLNAKNS